ncbi:hypothetical protein VIN30_03205, partial [Adlercreutzia sp. R7]|nr:hypothetical protein [Adlercreutzia sp. R7]
CQGSAGLLPAAALRERRKEILYSVPEGLSTTFFKIFENLFSAVIRKERIRTEESFAASALRPLLLAPSSSAG